MFSEDLHSLGGTKSDKLSKKLDYADIMEESVPETQTEATAEVAARFKKELQTVFTNSGLTTSRGNYCHALRQMTQSESI
jgi:hypothetical protein